MNNLYLACNCSLSGNSSDSQSSFVTVSFHFFYFLCVFHQYVKVILHWNLKSVQFNHFWNIVLFSIWNKAQTLGTSIHLSLLTVVRLIWKQRGSSYCSWVLNILEEQADFDQKRKKTHPLWNHSPLLWLLKSTVSCNYCVQNSGMLVISLIKENLEESCL